MQQTQPDRSEMPIPYEKQQIYYSFFLLAVMDNFSPLGTIFIF